MSGRTILWTALAVAGLFVAAGDALGQAGCVGGEPNGSCEEGENYCNCPGDCAASNFEPNCRVADKTCNNNGTCDANENPCNCPNDCPAPAGNPDLIPVIDDIKDVEKTLRERVDRCAVLEGCIADCAAQGAETCRLLRFSVSTRNIGAHDALLGSPCDGNAPRPGFEWDPCHQHFHFVGFAEFRLLRGGNVVVRGRKTGFCIGDNRANDGRPAPCHYSCACQGLQRGWSDTYGNHLPCQWLDVTGVPPGQYTLEVRLDPDNKIKETNEDNNVASVPVKIPERKVPASAAGGMMILVLTLSALGAAVIRGRRVVAG